MTVLQIILFVHVVAGFTALFTGPVAMLTKKGGKHHNRWGMVYTYGMTTVFVTACVTQLFRFTPFLFMIAFLSYYSVFSGVRFTRLKKLHQDQRPEWYDWAAAAINGMANLAFFGYGLFHALNGGGAMGYLSMMFGTLGIALTFNNLGPFLKKPKHPMYWWISHMGNMMGGYIATTTAFSTTFFGIIGVNSPLIWMWPLFIGIPASQIWQNYYTKKFKMKPAKKRVIAS